MDHYIPIILMNHTMSHSMSNYESVDIWSRGYHEIDSCDLFSLRLLLKDRPKLTHTDPRVNSLCSREFSSNVHKILN